MLRRSLGNNIIQSLAPPDQSQIFAIPPSVKCVPTWVLISDSYIQRLGQEEAVTKAESKVLILPKLIYPIQNKLSPVQMTVLENNRGRAKLTFIQKECIII